jgi:hypothetical protein
MQKVYLYIIGSISFMVVLFQGCVSLPSDVIMPQWDTDLNLPITTKSYTLKDIIKTQNYISINPQDNTYMISSDSLTQIIPISQFMQINTESSTGLLTLVAGVVPPETYIQFPDSAKLTNAEISKGFYNIIANNTNAYDVLLTISFPGLTKNGNLYPAQFKIPAYSVNFTGTVDFKDCTYAQPDNQDFSFDGQLWIKTYATSTGPYPQRITIESSTKDFEFKSVTGYLPTKSLGIHSSSFPLNVGDASQYRNKVVLKTASLTLVGKFNPPSSNHFPVGVNNLQLIGKRKDSQLTKTLQFTDPQANSFKFDASGNYATEYNESNSNITSFITFLPDSIYVSAEYIMNPDDNPDYKSVSTAESISFTSRFTSKSVLSIKQATFTDTIDINIDQNNIDQIINGKGAQLTADIQNGIPMNTWIKVILTDKNYHPLLINGAPFVITKNLNGTDSVSISGALTDINGNYSGFTSSSTTIELDSLQIKEFAQNAQHAIIDVTVATSNVNNLPVVVHSTDWIKLNVYGKVTYRIKKN